MPVDDIELLDPNKELVDVLVEVVFDPNVNPVDGLDDVEELLDPNEKLVDVPGEVVDVRIALDEVDATLEDVVDVRAVLIDVDAV